MNTLQPWVRGLLPALFITLAIVLSTPLFAHAATFTIADGDVAGLIAAINAANNNGTNPGPDTIRLAENGTYTLTAVNNSSNGLPRITSEITINGRGSTIQRSSGVGTPNFRFFQVQPNGDLTINNLTLSGGVNGSGAGGAIWNNQGKVKIKNSVVTGNTASGGGGGVYSGGAMADLKVVDSTISNNAASSGGGLYVASGSDTSVSNSSIVGNNVSGAGGGVFAGLDAKVTVLNSTVSGNSAGQNGGGIMNLHASSNPSTVVVIHSTVVGNTAQYGGGIFSLLNNTTRIKNSVIANNTATIQGVDCNGQLKSLGYNLIENLTNCTLGGGGVGDITGVDPNLGPLVNNGGETMTHLPLTGSLVIDAVPLADCTKPNGNPVTEDQRAVARPQPVGGNCDIGAVEVEPPVVPPGVAITNNLSVENWGVSGLFGSFGTTSQIVLTDLEPGDYAFYAAEGNTPGFSFTVGADGTVTSPACSAPTPYAECGNSYLTINGLPITVSGYPGTSQSLVWGVGYIGNGFNPENTSNVYGLIPGNYFVYTAQGNVPSVPFTVEADGAVTSPGCTAVPAYATCGLLSFAVNGLPITITGYPNTNLSPVWGVGYIGGGFHPGNSSDVYNLIPGNYHVYNEQGNVAGVPFTVEADGTTTSPGCSASPSYATCGSYTFTVDGLPATVIGHLSLTWGVSYIGPSNPGESSSVYNFIPGSYSVYVDNGNSPGFAFSIDANGLFQGAPATILDAGNPVPVSGNGTATLTLGSPSCTTAPSGMLAWWKGDGDATDSVDGFDGTLIGDASYTAGMVGQSFSFDGSGDQVSLSSAPSASDFTIDGWVRIAQYTIGVWPYQTIYADNSRGLWLKDGHINWWAPSSDKFLGTTQIPLNVWTHITLTYVGGTFTGYVNGAFDGTSVSPGQALPTGTVGIGGHSQEHLYGDIDELQIFNRALSQSEIQTIVDAGSAGVCMP